MGMISGRVTGREVKKNRDGTKSVALLQVELTDPEDIQTVELMSQTGEESNPPNDSKVTVVNIGEAWKLAIASDDKIVPSISPGEKKIYSTDPTGSSIKAFIHCKNDGTIIIDNGAGSIILSPSGELTIVAPDDTTITSPTISNIGQIIGSLGLQINGSTPGGNGAEIVSNLVAGGDIVGALVSLFNHTHTGITVGIGTSGPPVGGGGGPTPSFVWGGIVGTVASQSDLQSELDAKANTFGNRSILESTTAIYSTGEEDKLALIEDEAEVNNISDDDADVLAGGPTSDASDKHFHPGAGAATTAEDVATDTSNFNNNLSASDNNVQKALETLDSLAGGVGLSLDNIRKTDTFLDGDLVAGILNVDVSSLSETGALHVTVTDENDEDVDVNNVDQNTVGTVKITLLSYQPIAPTWNYRISV